MAKKVYIKQMIGSRCFQCRKKFPKTYAKKARPAYLIKGDYPAARPYYLEQNIKRQYIAAGGGLRKNKKPNKALNILRYNSTPLHMFRAFTDQPLVEAFNYEKLGWEAMTYFGSKMVKKFMPNKVTIFERHLNMRLLKNDTLICEKCDTKNYERQHEVEKEALQSFMGDKSVKKVLFKKIDARLDSAEDLDRVRRGLHMLSPILSEWHKKQPKIDIDKVKTVPIGQLMPAPPKRKQGNREMFLCPLKTEKTPSFFWFKDKNKFNCFGCLERGSVIDLYMKLNNCNFRTAIRALDRM